MAEGRRRRFYGPKLRLNYLAQFAAFGTPSQKTWAQGQAQGVYRGGGIEGSYEEWLKSVEAMIPETAEGKAKKSAELRARIGARGRRMTVLTGPRGVTQPPTLLRKKLLGE